MIPEVIRCLWRKRSILLGILVHATMNLVGGLLLIGQVLGQV